MSDERIVKKAVLGSWDMERTRSGNSRGNTIQYWRRLLKEAGHEDDNSENLTNGRKRWKKTVTDRRTFLKNWETQMCNWHRGSEKPARSQWNRERISDSGWPCRWDGCDKKCASKGGRANHERKAHRRESVDYKCLKCNDSLSDQAALTNHFKACQGGQGGFCPKCQKSLSLINMARHRRTCRGEHPTAPEVTNTIITGRFAGTRARIQCEECGTWVTKNNISRHRITCPGNWESRPPHGA
ncbi:zinc finger protein 525-like [Symsagittifera roscoffensis]|uniref:zinc finger protein 525-like n=1 Tax=Symsagittifera roscoffensis TaxID=84072 RepID=UPI00307C3031